MAAVNSGIDHEAKARPQRGNVAVLEFPHIPGLEATEPLYPGGFRDGPNVGDQDPNQDPRGFPQITLGFMAINQIAPTSG